MAVEDELTHNFSSSPMASKKKTPVAKQETAGFRITVNLVGGQTLVGEGATCLAALQAIKKPAKIVSKAIVTIENGDLKTDRYFMPVQLNRIFYSSPRLQEIHAKQLSFGLKGVKVAA